MYGGADFQKRQRTAPTDAIMQAGSTFKRVALIGGLEQGISTRRCSTAIADHRGHDQVPNEFNQSFGTIDLRRVTASR